jgi:hypothetical protein
MRVSTKNGRVVLKSGGVAQNCGCCECTPFIAISIIDEDDGYSPPSRRNGDWNCFRQAHPSSPFFLLAPISGYYGQVTLPVGWDGVQYEVSRDDGNSANATDYYDLLGLESLLEQYERIVLVVDNSGSMNSFTVRASLDLLYSRLESQHGITEASGSLVRINIFNENWIDPFANICQSPSGGSGACCSVTSCDIRPECQCVEAAGEVFKGVGTVCSPSPCCVDASGTPCTSLPNGGRPNVVSLTISGTGSVTLNRTFTLTWNASAFRYENAPFPGEIVRIGTKCTEGCGSASSCRPLNPELRAYITVDSFWRIGGSYQDYWKLPDFRYNQGCDNSSFPVSSFPLYGGFFALSSLEIRCRLCDPSYGGVVAGGFVNPYQSSHGEVVESIPTTATLSANPLP